MNSIGKIFARGFLALIPIVLTLYIVSRVILILDGLLGNLLQQLLPEAYYWPGQGLILSLVLIYGFGVLLNYYLAQRLIQLLENQLLRLPLLKAIYSPLKEIVQLFSKNNTQMGYPVFIEITPGVKAFGLVTREEFDGLFDPAEVLKDHVSVYIPLSYALGGYTLLVKRDQIQPVPLKADQALSLAITGWIKTKPPQEPQHDME